MSYFKAIMHQNRFPLGLGPRPRWGRLLTALPRPLAGFKGLTSKAGGGLGKGGEGREGGRKGRREEGREGEGKGGREESPPLL